LGLLTEFATKLQGEVQKSIFFYLVEMGGGGSYFNASPKDAYFSELPLNQSILNLLGHSIAHFIIENNSAFFDQGIVNRIWSEFIIV